MKISVILDKKSRFNIDLPETRAELLYKDLIGSIMDSYYSQEDIAITPVLDFKESVYSIRKAIVEESFLERIKKVAEETGKSIEKESTPKLKAGLLEVIEDTPAIRGEIYNQNGEIKKNLVMIKCGKCGHVATPTLFMKNRELIHKEHSLTCRECGEELPQITEINHAKYNCPNCNTNAGFYVANGLKEVECKECKSPIDLVWHEKRGIYISANLLERGDK